MSLSPPLLCLPGQYGLYSSFAGCFVYCFLGTSRDVTLGPTAIMSLLVSFYTFRQPAYAVLLSFLSGAIQLAMGIFHLGFLLDFISSPVIKGFTSAASVTIGFGQVKVRVLIRGIYLPTLLYQNCSMVHFPELLVGGGTLLPVTYCSGGVVCWLVCLLLPGDGDPSRSKNHPEMNWPALLTLSAAALTPSAALPSRNALVVSFAGLTAYSFQATGSQPFTLTGRTAEGLPPFRPPPFSVVSGNETVPFSGMVQDMGSGLAVVPLMGLLESIAIAKAFASQNGYRIDANQELLAIGLTNLLGSFVSSYPVTGSFGRQAVEPGLEPRSFWAVVLLSLAYLTPLFYYIPKAALAAVIITAVAPLFDVGIFRTLWRVKRLDLVPLCATFLLCFWEVQYGIIAGVLVSGLLLLHAVARPRIQVTEGEVVVLRPASGLHFPAAEALREAVYSRALKVTPPRCAILDCTHVSSIDSTVVAGLEELLEEFRHRGVSLVFSGLQAPILWILLTAELRGFQHFSTVEEAEKHLREEPGTESYHANESPSPKSRIDQ
uniref:Sodium-independent sulfate anion transporter n=1 Tax=Ornithorhynchus anatinus TaxID=9258 RepID=F6XCE1_ORNAN